MQLQKICLRDENALWVICSSAKIQPFIFHLWTQEWKKIAAPNQKSYEVLPFKWTETEVMGSPGTWHQATVPTTQTREQGPAPPHTFPSQHLTLLHVSHTWGILIWHLQCPFWSLTSAHQARPSSSHCRDSMQSREKTTNPHSEFERTPQFQAFLDKGQWLRFSPPISQGPRSRRKPLDISYAETEFCFPRAEHLDTGLAATTPALLLLSQPFLFSFLSYT